MPDLPPPVLLGYRPRRCLAAPESYALPGVLIASASDCLVDAVVPPEPDWDHMNNALHYDSAEEADAAAHRVGATGFEVHATRLWPLRFDSRSPEPFSINLRRLDDRPSQPKQARLESLGFDVVSIELATPDGGPYDYVPFSCAPLSCNSMGSEYGVNRWCLLDNIEGALSAAADFGAEQPEPGPFVVVEVLRRR